MPGKTPFGLFDTPTDGRIKLHGPPPSAEGGECLNGRAPRALIGDWSYSPECLFYLAVMTFSYGVPMAGHSALGNRKEGGSRGQVPVARVSELESLAAPAAGFCR